MRKSSDKKGRTRNAFADARLSPPGKRRRRRLRFTRDLGLLVRDEDIHNFVGHLKWGQLTEVAGRFDAIACLIFEDLHTQPIEARQTLAQRIAERVPRKVPKIRKIGRESRARDYRKIVKAIEEAVRAGDGFSARRTAEAVVEEAFRYTSYYSRAMEEFCLSLRAMRRGVRG
ncbi:MAG TPA: hypothetical protein VJX67_11270 [Blastocatellia bacterium]|nr:hypothetical protein [Blastocatellia bacterium]